MEHANLNDELPSPSGRRLFRSSSGITTPTKFPPSNSTAWSSDARSHDSWSESQSSTTEQRGLSSSWLRLKPFVAKRRRGVARRLIKNGRSNQLIKPQCGVDPGANVSVKSGTAHPLKSRFRLKNLAARHLAARRLVKQAKRVLNAKSRDWSQQEQATTSRPNELRTLTDQEADAIFKRSCSPRNFAVNLLLSLFTVSELVSRSGARLSTWTKPDDVERLRLIRRQIEQRVGPGQDTWRVCWQAIGMKVYYLKKQGQRKMR